jgi:DNA-binding NarL/FixJ family response regulator
VGEAADGFKAIESVKRHKPDVILLDLVMPRLSGTEAIRGIKEAHPPTKVLVLTSHLAEEQLAASLRAGADGYVVKEAEFQELLLAVQSVLQGYPYVSPQVCAPLIKGFLRAPQEGSSRTAFDDLSERERTVLKLMAEGHRTRRIGELLCLSPKTVEKAATTLRKKLGIQTVQGLTAFAIQRGLIAGGDAGLEKTLQHYGDT